MASAIVGALRVVLGADTAAFEKGMSRSASHLKKVGAQMKNVGRTLSVSVTAPLAAAATIAVQKFGKQEDALAAVEAAVKSTGAAAGFTTEELARMASKLQQISTFGDEDILHKVTANLLTFTQVVGPEFERAQEAVLNLSARLGQDLQQSAIQVGKALNDPILGLTALRRVGIQLSEQQQEQVKDFVKTGQVAKAQGVILDELNTQFGGQASAIARTMKGQLTQAANAWGDAMETVGKAIAPMVIKIANGVKYLSERFQELDPIVVRMIVTLAGLAAAIGPALIGIGLMATGLAAIGGPATAAILIVGALTTAVVAFWPHIERAAAAVANAVPQIYTNIKTWLMDKLEPIWEWIGAKIDWFKRKFREAAEFFGAGDFLDSAKEVASGVASGVAEVLSSPVRQIQALGDSVVSAWTGVGAKVDAGAEGWAAQIARPMTRAAEKAGQASEGLNQAAALMFQHQNQLFEQGKALAENLRTPMEEYQAQLARINELLRVGAINQETYRRAVQNAAERSGMSWGSSAESITGSFAEIADSFGEHSSRMAKTAQILGAVQALISTFVGQAKALELPFPENFAAMAAIAAKGFALVAAIRAQSVPGFATGGSFKVGGIGGTDSQLVQFMATPGEMVEVRRPDQQRAGTTDVLRLEGLGEGWLSMIDWREFIRRLNRAIADGAGRLEIAAA